VLKGIPKYKTSEILFLTNAFMISRTGHYDRRPIMLLFVVNY